MPIEETKTSVITPSLTVEDESLDTTLRPRQLDDFIGQSQLKKSLNIFLKAAQERGEALEHVLLAGPPGLGKTSLAHIIARELSSNLRITAGPVLTKVADLAAILTSLQPDDVLFIDEIHRLPRAIEEVLYPAMEGYKLDIVVGQGAGAKTLRIDLPQFTLVGATTRVGMLGGPLRDRFGMTYRFNFYTEKELQDIIRRSSALLKLSIDEDALLELAKRSRRTPRIANRLLKRIRDYAQVHRREKIDSETVQGTLDLLEVDDLGLDTSDRRILEVMINQFSGGPVGIQTLAAMSAEEERTIEEVIEPYLLQCGLIIRTPRGREVTPAGYEHIAQ